MTRKMTLIALLALALGMMTFAGNSFEDQLTREAKRATQDCINATHEGGLELVSSFTAIDNGDGTESYKVSFAWVGRPKCPGNEICILSIIYKPASEVYFDSNGNLDRIVCFDTVSI